MIHGSSFWRTVVEHLCINHKLNWCTIVSFRIFPDTFLSCGLSWIVSLKLSYNSDSSLSSLILGKRFKFWSSIENDVRSVASVSFSYQITISAQEISKCSPRASVRYSAACDNTNRLLMVPWIVNFVLLSINLSHFYILSNTDVASIRRNSTSKFWRFCGWDNFVGF